MVCYQCKKLGHFNLEKEEKKTFLKKNIGFIATWEDLDLSSLLYIKHKLEDCNIYLLCDNITAINLSKNPILYSKTIHIEIKHHFIMDYIQKKIFNIKFINTNEQLVNISTKPLLEDKLIHIRELLGMKFIKE
ncbi:Copia protein, partial [Mucuna pruriens]